MHSPVVVTTGRDLRLDLFRGLALWLIFLDHIPSNVVSWITIRNYGFSDATEIFIFISGYTAAFVYGKAMLDRGFVISGARILRRAWQIYVAHIFLFAIYMAEIAYVATSFENPLYAEEMNILDFLKNPDQTIIQALLLKFKPANMDVLPLYIVLLILFPPILWLLQRGPTLALAVSVAIYVIAWKFNLNLPGYPSGVWYFNPFAWQLLFVFGAWCALGGADAARPGAAVAHHHGHRARLYRLRTGGRAHLVHSGAYPLCAPAGVARGPDLPDRQDQPRRAALRPLPGARSGDGPLRAADLAATAVVGALSRHPVRPAFTRNFLFRRLLGLCGPLRPCGSIGGDLDAVLD